MNRTNNQNLWLTLITCHGLVLHHYCQGCYPIAFLFTLHVFWKSRLKPPISCHKSKNSNCISQHTAKKALRICTDKHDTLYLHNVWVSGTDTGLKRRKLEIWTTEASPLQRRPSREMGFPAFWGHARVFSWTPRSTCTLGFSPKMSGIQLESFP